MRSSVMSSRRDYSAVLDRPSRGARWRRRAHWPVAVLTAVVLGGGSALLLDERERAGEPQELAVKPPSTASLNPIASADASAVHAHVPPATDDQADQALDTLSTEAVAPSAAASDLPALGTPTEQWLEMTVAKGDTLSGLFNRYDLAAADWMALARLDGAGKQLSRMRPGDILRVSIGDDRRVSRLRYALDEIRTIDVQRSDDDSFRAEEIVADIETRVAYATGTITSSLFLAARDAGMTDRTTMGLAAIFGWDIDFALDIRQGDRFAVVYEELYLDGEKLRDGPILAAEFVNAGRTIRAVRYVDTNGDASYYTPGGDSMRKAFIRTPVDFARISSSFSLGRRHPILNKIRAHRGVDYAAPAGTPIKAAGDGKVILAGTKGGYGRTVRELQAVVG